MQPHNISVECGINYRAQPVTQRSVLQKVMRSVNNRPAAAILHIHGERCICANFARSMYSVMDSLRMEDIWGDPVGVTG